LEHKITPFIISVQPSRVVIINTYKKAHPNVLKFIKPFTGSLIIFPQMYPLAQSVEIEHF